MALTRAAPDQPPRLVVLRALGLGDLLTAVPALRALGRAFPGHRRVLATPRHLGALVRAIGPADGPQGPGWEVADAHGLEPLPAWLHRAEVAVNLHGRGPQSHRLLQATRPGRLVAFHHPKALPDPRAAQWRAGEHEVTRWCRLLDHAGIPADPAQLELRPPPGPVPAGAAGATLLHPGAASPARRWPLDRWAQVALAERSLGRRVVITGSADERALCLELARRAGLGPDAVLAGRTDLGELARAVAAADRVACGDTGVAHLASALGTPSVVLFGPTSPATWGPPSRARHRVLWAGRTGDPHGRRADPGLLEIHPQDVAAALAALPQPDRQLAAAS